MTAKKWARKARTIVVHLEEANGTEFHGWHLIEIRDSKRRIIRRRTIQYRNTSPSLSTVMLDVQARLARNALVVEADSYQLLNGGDTLSAVVHLSGDRRSRAS